jgi:hypothetical protein
MFLPADNYETFETEFAKVVFVLYIKSQFQKSSKILKIHRCDLKAGRFRWLFIQ